MASKQKVTMSQIKQALEASGGNVSQAANSLPITRERLHQRIRANDGLKQFLEDMRVCTSNMADSNIRKAIEGGDVDASFKFKSYEAKIEKLKMDNLRHERLYTKLYTKNDDVIALIDQLFDIVANEVSSREEVKRIGIALQKLGK